MLKRRGLKSKDAAERRTAAQELGSAGDGRAVKPLIGALGDEEPSVREAAAEALGRLRDARGVEPLIAALADQACEVQRVAAKALGELGDTRAVKPLIAALGDEETSLRRRAAEALGELGDPRAVEPLMEALADQAWEDRRGAAKALGELGDTRAVEPLIGALGDKIVATEAATALGKLGDPRAVEPLIVTLLDEDTSLREAATEALGDLGDARAVEPLIEALADQPEWLRRVAAKTLSELGDAAMEPLITALGSEAPYEGRRLAAKALEELGWRPDDDSQRAQTAIALGDWDEVTGLGSAATELLIPLLGDHSLHKDNGEYERVSFRAGEALRRLGWRPDNDSQRAQLAVAVQDGDELRRLGSPAVKPLIALADTDFGPPGMWAADMLRELIDALDPQAIAILAERLTAGEPVPRGTIEGLLRLLRDEREIRAGRKPAPEQRFEIAPDVLRTLARLPSAAVWQVGTQGSCAFETSVLQTEQTDCHNLRQLARQTLIRRGLES